MRSATCAVTILILASMLAGFSSATQSSPAQVVTSYSYSEVPVSTFTWTSTVGQGLVSDSFPVPGAGNHACNVIYDNFTGPAGPVSGTMTASSPVDFYLVSKAEFFAWATLSHVESCDGPTSFLASRPYATSYSFAADLPQSGEYFLVFVNSSSTSTSNVAVTVNSVGSPVTYTTTSDSLYMQTILVTLQSVSQFYTSAQQSSNPTISGSFPVIDIAAIVLVILIVAGLLFYNERRVRASAKVKDTVKPQATEISSVPSRGATKPIVADSATMFCRKCGAKIPRDSTFCKECGEKTKA